MTTQDGWYEMTVVDAAEVEGLVPVERRTSKYLPIFNQLSKLPVGKALRIETADAEEMRNIREAVNNWARRTGRSIKRRRKDNVLFVLVEPFQKARGSD